MPVHVVSHTAFTTKRCTAALLFTHKETDILDVDGIPACVALRLHSIDVVLAQPFDLILSPHVELLSQLLEFVFFGLLERAFVESPPQSRCQKEFRVSGSR